ncbi:hypothetical protein QYF36_025897 [Acer negundo]|nr:hypothetical protein QYF36_025897 [Acer negundo]
MVRARKNDDEELPYEQPTGGVNIGPANAGVEVGSGSVNSRPVGVDIGPASAGAGASVEVGSGGVNSKHVGVDIGPAGASAGVEVGSGGVNIEAASVETRLGGGGVEIGSASVVGNIGDELNVKSTENKEIVKSDYEQEPEDIAANTCVDPTRGSDDLRSLDGSDGEEDDGGPTRKFIKTNYHEFNPRRDLQDPKFRVAMEFGSADLFRKAIKAHVVKHRRVVKFKKNDPNRVRAVYMGEGCQWFVYESWLADHKTFKIKSLVDEHTCVMSFKNKFVSSKMIAEKYVGQWRVNPDWNFAGLSQQLRIDTNVDTSIWQYYRARKAARQMIQGNVKEQYSKHWEYGAEIRRMNPRSTVMIKCTKGHGDKNPRFKHSMERMRIESEDAYKWLADKDPNHWLMGFFKDTTLCDMLCNNMCEAFNKAILQAHDKPVITLMEMIRNYLMKMLLESSIFQSDYSGNNKYQVKGLGDEQYMVDIENKTCACNKWQMIGIPCIHGTSALSSSNRDPYQFIDIKKGTTEALVIERLEWLEIPLKLLQRTEVGTGSIHTGTEFVTD